MTQTDNPEGGGGDANYLEEDDVDNSFIFDIVPWLEDLETLTEAERSGYKLVNNPAGYIAATVLSWIIESTWGVLTAIESMLMRSGGSASDAISSSGTAVLESFGVVGDRLLVVLIDLDGTLYSVAYEAGPTALIMVPVVWIATLAVAYGVTRLTVWAIPQVIPWL